MYSIPIILSSTILLIGVLCLRMAQAKRYRASLFLSVFILLYKFTEYSIFGLNMRIDKIPIEFSTVSYFVYSTTVLFDLKPLKSLAAFMAFISGIGYLITFMFLGRTFHDVNGSYITSMAFINHSILFIGSMMLLKDIRMDSREVNKIMAFSVLYVSYVALLDRFIEFSQSHIFIRMLLGGELLSDFINVGSHYTYLIYMIAIFAVYRMILSIFQAIWNHTKQHVEV